jgi:tetratricopeptide (TPR) repeat protein
VEWPEQASTDGEGRAKNGQVKRIFDLLFSDEYSSAPIDLVLVCQDEYIPRAFRRDHVPKSWNIALLERQNLDAKSVAANKRRWETLDLGDGPNRPASEITSVEDVVWQRPEEPAVPEPWHALRVGKIRTAPPNSEYRTASVAIHILHEARATIITASYFPRIGLLLARHQLREDTEFWNWIELSRSKTRQFPQIFEEDATDFRNAMREALNEVRPEGPIPPKKLIPVITVQLAVMLELGLIDGATGALEKKFRELLRKFNSIEETSVGSAGPNEGVASCAFSAILDALDEIPGATPWPRDSDWSREQTARLHRVIGAYDHRMRDLHNAVAGGRYLLTLLLSAAYETTTALSAPRFPPRKFIPIEEMDAVTYSVDRFLDRAVLSLIGVPTKRRSDVVIQQFLAVIHRHHERNEEMPIQVKLKWERPQFVDNRTASPAIYRLLMELVWHLSIIGQAVEADVLAWCPRVREACDGLTDGSIALTDRQYLDCVDEALALGVNRCLIFELRPEVTSSLPERRRYAVHGLVQRDVFRKLGTPDAEFTDTDQFTLSLYASQPDDLPRLSRDAHNQIATTIAALAGYPDMQAGGKGKIGARGARAELHKDLPPDYRKRLLRAAFGVMRSIYSVAVLARFDHDPDGEEGTPGHEGYFEEYRRVVRWILGAALDIGTMGQGSEKGTYAPFYAEEIVWLYNECAVLSLVQGRLNDAQALFEAALLAAKRIEPDESGALHIRILLNKAVVDIERGYGLAARAYLERIAHLVNEHPVPPLLAKGYLGLIDHLAGEVEAAIVEYREAITGLMKLRRSRSASIFSRHLGDLLGNNLGEARSEEAKQEIHNAIHFAQEGGHEDIRHMALLSLARWRLRGTQNIDTAEFHRELDTVERYAKVVGMPRLLCEVGLVRARLLLLQGEARLAGTIATQSLQIATVNDLRIRKIGSLLLLAEIYLKRGDKHAVRPILQLGARMAKLYNHFFALTYAQNFASLVDPELG